VFQRTYTVDTYACIAELYDIYLKMYGNLLKNSNKSLKTKFRSLLEYCYYLFENLNVEYKAKHLSNIFSKNRIEMNTLISQFNVLGFHHITKVIRTIKYWYLKYHSYLSIAYRKRKIKLTFDLLATILIHRNS